jgi:hypothetical protein
MNAPVFRGQSRWGARDGAAMTTVGVLFIASALAILLGLLAYTSSPILVALAASAVAAPILAFRPQFSLWLLLVGGLLIAGLVPIWSDGQAGRAVWGLSALSFFLLLTLVVQAAMSSKVRRDTPGFVWILLALVVFASVVSLLRWAGAYEFLSGFKRYFQAFGVLAAFAWLGLTDRDLSRIRTFVLIVAVVQLPWAAYELVRLVPIREATRLLYPGMIPIDVVAGTFGANLTKGGANGEMAAFLIVVLGFMLSRMRHQVPGARRLMWLAPLVALPLFMGETKVVVVLIPLLFATLYRRALITRPLVGLGGLLVGVLLTAGVTTAYLTFAGKDLSTQVSDTLDYNVRDRAYGGLLLNRTTVIGHWAGEQGLADPLSPVVGNGLGSAHDATGGHVARRYPGYGISLTAASILLWEVGILGFGLVLLALAAAWRCASRIAGGAVEPWVKADAEALQAALPLFAFYLFYRPAMLEGFPFQIFFCGLLGYLAWLARREAVLRRRG